MAGPLPSNGTTNPRHRAEGRDALPAKGINDNLVAADNSKLCMSITKVPSVRKRHSTGIFDIYFKALARKKYRQTLKTCDGTF
jgi:hypothetical protein